MRASRCKKELGALLLSFLFVMVSTLTAGEDDVKLSLDKLFSLKVTSVSGTAMNMKESPAAIHVITAEDFKKQGHLTIAEALRNVPGFYVSQVNSSQWSISSRGFAGRFANKLLVLIDGRSVYTPLFSGVYWEMQDMVLDDIDRIEVIRGPGATLWGANAVNGVINIVTKSARETVGGHLKLGAGNHEEGYGHIRWGDQLSDDLFYRIWGKYSNRDASFNPSGLEENDQWDLMTYGARFDWYVSPKDTLSLITNFAKTNDVGDRTIQASDTDFTFSFPHFTPSFPGIYSSSSIRGDQTYDYRNLTLKWEHLQSATSGFALQGYYDFTRTNNLTLEEDRTTFDLDFRHWFDINPSNSFIYGLGVRTTKDKIGSTYITEVTPDNRRATTVSMFLQNTTRLTDDISLMYGSKIEHNDYTGVEIQPSVRLTYNYSPDTVWWASISRAVRTPSRVDDDFIQRIPTGGFVSLTNNGSRDGDSEELMAYELGFRTDLFDKKVTLDLAAFYNDYSHLSEMYDESGGTLQGTLFDPDGAGPAPAVLVPAGLAINSSRRSDMHGEAYGLEATIKYHVTKNWDLTANYTYYKLNLHGYNTAQEDAEDETPENLFNFQSDYRFNDKLSWHALAYYADSQAENDIKSYIRVDTGLIYKLTDKVSLAAWGRNLLDPYHPEAHNILTTQNHQIGRSFTFEVSIKF